MSADRSQTERIRRLRAQIQAVRRAECGSCPEEGPWGPTDQSTWLSRRFGQMAYLRENAVGVVTVSSCCAPAAPVCVPENIPVDCCLEPPCLGVETDPTKCYTFTAASFMFLTLISDTTTTTLALGAGQTSLSITGITSYKPAPCTSEPVICSEPVVTVTCSSPGGTVSASGRPPILFCFQNGGTNNLTLILGGTLSITLEPAQIAGSVPNNTTYTVSC